VSVAFQPSLFDGPETGVGSLSGLRRTVLSRGAWVDVLPGWITGADELFASLVDEIPWRAESREMYERMVDVPRLVHTYGIGDELPDPVLVHARDELTRHYAKELGEPFVTAGCCYYRDGQDSVAWHGDNLGRGRSQDTIVAIVSLG
jgi:alkylated DNA repair dioxygenase AlkB